MNFNVQSLAFFVPETVLSLSAIVLLVWAIVPARAAASALAPKWPPEYSSWFAIAVLALSFILLARGFDSPAGSLFGGLINNDRFAVFFRFIFVSTAGLVIIFSQRARDLGRAGTVSDAPEYYSLILGMVVGMSLLAGTTNILVIYLALEFVSLMSYLLVGFAPRDERSKEAALKYLLFGAVASGVFLFGASIFYGLAGSLDITIARGANLSGPAFALSVVLMLAGFLYKIAAAPMHAWCPDAYEGAPIPVAAFLSVAPKAAGFAVLMRVSAIIGVEAHWPLVIAVISAVTMTFGNLAAIPQMNVKRLLAYSSIAHAGYLLMGVASTSQKGNEAVYFYLIAYLIMNLGAFLAVEIVANENGSETIEAFSGLGRRGARGTITAIAMTVFLLSLTGIPPFAGFIGKFYLFWAVLDARLYWLAVVGIINSVISLYYYMRVVKAMFFGEAESSGPLEGGNCRLFILIVILAIVTIAMGLAWSRVSCLVSAV